MVLDKIFGWARRKEEDPPIHFGRYSDNNKSVEKVQRWTDADNLFKERKFTESIEAFLEYLRDDDQGNVVVDKQNGNLQFQIYQGSTIARGEVTAECVKAEIPLARMKSVTVPAMRKLLEMNFNLFYTRYAFDKDVVYIRFDSPLTAATPNKLYYGLKELCTKGDKQDDLLTGEFTSLEAIDVEHIEEIPEEEKNLKFEYLQKWIKETLALVGKLDHEKFSGGISYLLLSLVFRIDYLITPEGKMLNELEKIATTYYSNKDEKASSERNPVMIEGFRKLLQKPKEELFSQLFRSKYTFAIVVPHNLKSVAETIETSLENMSWYRDNNYPDMANRVMEYGFAYSQYSYSLPKPLSDLFRLFMHVNYSGYFKALGFKTEYYDEEKNVLNEQEIEDRIELIINYWKRKYALLNFRTKKLKYDTLVNFNHTFLQEVASLNLD
jgi:hypothetical protein